jgi:hypothetical protein
LGGLEEARMKIIRWLTTIAAATVLAIVPMMAAGTSTVELPDAPSGFSWKQIPEIKAAFLFPQGWQFKKEKQGATLAYFMTPTKFDKQPGFDTGLTINVFKRLKDRNAVTYAQEFIANLASRHELVKQWETSIGHMQGYGCQVKMTADDEGHPATRVHYLAIASRTTNTLYVLFFEAPEEAWESAWESGRQMLELFIIDDEV